MNDSEQSSGLNDAGGCVVDWSWLQGQRIAAVTNALDVLTLTLEGGRTLNVRALLWKGKPFLSFDPHAPPARQEDNPPPVPGVP